MVVCLLYVYVSTVCLFFWLYRVVENTGAQLVMKTDDDCFVNVNGISAKVKSLYGQNRVLMGKWVESVLYFSLISFIILVLVYCYYDYIIMIWLTISNTCRLKMYCVGLQVQKEAEKLIDYQIELKYTCIKLQTTCKLIWVLILALKSNDLYQSNIPSVTRAVYKIFGLLYGSGILKENRTYRYDSCLDDLPHSAINSSKYKQKPICVRKFRRWKVGSSGYQANMRKQKVRWKRCWLVDPERDAFLTQRTTERRFIFPM